MKESDLYQPLKKFLESQNYEVKGEILNCDVMAIRNDEEPVIVELKRSLSLDIFLQAVQRLSMTSKVYICVPKLPKSLKRKQKHVIKLVKMLGLGLIVIDLNRKIGNVEILADPGTYKPRESKYRKERLLGEFMKRVGDPNLGGSSSRKGIMTAYRQQALAIARYLQENGSTKASEISKAIQEPKARSILYRNVYGWFDRISQGIYDISPKGQNEIPKWLDNSNN